jgi:hypothetical protein
MFTPDRYSPAAIPALPGYQHIWISMNPKTRQITTRRTPIIAWKVTAAVKNNEPQTSMTPVSMFNYEGLPGVSEFERYGVQDPQGNVTARGAYFPLGRDFAYLAETSLLNYVRQFD